jgi:phosphate-selective porin OprO/OprP
MKKLIAIIGLFAFMHTVTYSQTENNNTTFGKGIFNILGKDSTWSMNFSARVQMLSTSSWSTTDDKLSNPEQSFNIRRSRFKFKGFAYDPKLTYKIEMGLSNQDMSGASEFTSGSPRYIMDAVVMWNFYKTFTLWVGQTKLPGNVERVISSGDLQLVDRSLLNSRFNIDRDMGIQLRHHFNLTDKFLIREKIAVSQGEGRNVSTGNLGGHQFTARLELLPFGEFESKGDYSGGDLKREQSPKLSIASTYDFNNNAVRNRSNQGSYMENDLGFYETDIKTFFVDAMFKYKGFSFMGEYADRNAADPYAKNSDNSLTGDVVQVGKALNLQSGYLFKNNYEVAGRFTHIELDKTITGKNPENQYTLGMSKYIVGHKLKVQTDVSYLTVDKGTDQVMWRLQLDLHF